MEKLSPSSAWQAQIRLSPFSDVAIQATQFSIQINSFRWRRVVWFRCVNESVQSQGFWKSMTCFSFFQQFVFIYIHLVGTVSLRLFARTAPVLTFTKRKWREFFLAHSLSLCRFLFSSIFILRLTFYCTIVDYVCSIESLIMVGYFPPRCFCWRGKRNFVKRARDSQTTRTVRTLR